METGLLVRKLNGLLTKTGRIIDGKWVFCWRKQYGLLTETGWCVDGNWMVNSRKLVGPADFLNFGGLKMRFCRVPKPALSWTPSILQLIFNILEATKYDFYRVVKPRVQNYQASCEQILRILASWKCDFWRFKVPKARPKNAFCLLVKYTFQGYQVSYECIFRVTNSSAFWQHENAIYSDSWNQRFKVPRKDWGNFIHFSCLKCAFAQ